MQVALDDLQGSYAAPDGWVIIWDLARDPPQRISYIESDGTPEGHWSGRLDARFLARRLAEFKREHSGQMVLL
jgi:hypothetical protein